jgi:thiamine biosynthesis protein ThiC
VTAHGSPIGPLQFDRLEASLGRQAKSRAGGNYVIMAKLTTAARKKLPKSDFVEKGARKYPIPDAAHARDALARSSGKPEHASVVAAVRRKFPKIKITKKK